VKCCGIGAVCAAVADHVAERRVQEPGEIEAVAGCGLHARLGKEEAQSAELRTGEHATVQLIASCGGNVLTMKQFVGFAVILLASSADAGQLRYVATPSTTVTTAWDVTVGDGDEAGLICQTSARREPAPKLTVTITPSKVKINDASKKGTPLAKIAVSWSNGAPFTGKVTLTRNPGGICQVAGMEVQLGRDATKADDFTTSVCTVTATK
jgi:hypothetical protein